MAAQHQHYVPQLLLRGFLSRDADLAAKEQVHVMDLNDGRTFVPPIAKIMGERRFNDFWIEEDTLGTIEPAAGRIETHVAPLIERIRREKRLERSPEEFGDLALLMAFQFIRTKKMRLLPERLSRQLIEHVVKMGLDPGKVRGLEPLTEEMLKLTHVRQQIEGLENYTRLIAEKEFFLMTAPAGSSFYISDHPVALHNDEAQRGPFGQLGLGVPYIQIYLPLSADVMLCAYDPAVLGQLMKGRDALFKEMQIELLGMLQRRQIAPAEMRRTIELTKGQDLVGPLIETIRAGEAVQAGPEQVDCYNSLQCFHAHRFIVDPAGDFSIAREMMPEREKSD
jgi:hypothetical protein